MFRRLTASVNKTIVKPCVPALQLPIRIGLYVEFSRRKIPRTIAYTIAEKAIRFRHPDYNPDRAEKLISSSVSRHLSTRNISFKSIHAFLSNLADTETERQTDRQTRGNAFTSSFVGGNTKMKTNKKLDAALASVRLQAVLVCK